jgi:hypothetical protein
MPYNDSCTGSVKKLPRYKGEADRAQGPRPTAGRFSLKGRECK